MAELNADDWRSHRRYLLGELEEKEMAQLEERYFADQELFDLLEAVEDDLVDDYVRGILSEAEGRRFEQHYLNSPERRSKVEFAAELVRYLSQAPRAPWLASVSALFRAQRLTVQVSFGLAAVAVLVGGPLCLVQIWRSRAQMVQQLAAEEANTRREQTARVQLEQQLDELRLLQRGARAFVLERGVLRNAADASRLVIPPDTSLVRLQLDLDDQPPSQKYRAVLRNARQEVLWSQDLTESTAGPPKSPVATIPATVLGEGQFELSLRGANAQGGLKEIGVYSFFVVRR